MSVTVLDLEPAGAPDLGLADAAAEGRTLLRLTGGQLFSERSDVRRDGRSEHRAYVVTLGHESDRALLPLLLDACARAGLSTATVAAGDAGYAGLGRSATYRWEPAPLLPAPGLVLARHTVAATVAAVEELDPHLVVLDLADGWRELDLLVEHLRLTEHWHDSIVVALTEPARDLELVSRWLGTDL